jgi:hypothetical protein
LFLAAQAFLAYRKHGGSKTSPLPDFFIGAHAAALGFPILTRDVDRYRTYFPEGLLVIRTMKKHSEAKGLSLPGLKRVVCRYATKSHS